MDANINMNENENKEKGKIKTTIQCHCQLTSLNLLIPRSSLPLKSAICHCDSCRHSTGQLFATWAVIHTSSSTSASTPTAVEEELQRLLPQNGGNLAEFEFSSTCQRYFCRRCGASVLNVDRGDKDTVEWEVGTGVLHFDDDNADEEDDDDDGARTRGAGSPQLTGNLRRVQLWVEDVKGDGGAVGWINAGRLEGMDRHWRGRQSELVSDDAVKKLMTTTGGARAADVADEAPGDDHTEPPPSTLQVQCRCENITFSISRPLRTPTSGSSGKFQASLDACTSCRTVSGFEITSWVFVPRDRIMVDNSKDLDAFLADRSRLGHYKTSSDVSRYFCRTCGATVFYYKHGLDTIDVGIGLLKPGLEDHARVGSWVEWEPHPKCLAYQEDAVDAEFVGNLAEGMRLWAESGI